MGRAQSEGVRYGVHCMRFGARLVACFVRSALAAVIVAAVAARMFLPLTLAHAAPATAPFISPTASCAELARLDPTATNGALWGQTILPGLGAAGGWFGVPVCANGVNEAAPGGANVSCDATPADLAVSGCAPSRATSDGYGLSFQCVELVARFAAWAYGDAPGGWRGDAPYLWLSGHHPSDFHAEANSVALQAPQPGDILVWGSLDSQGRPWPAGPAGGHVAVVSAVGGGGHFTFVEENMLGHRGSAAYNIPSETTTLTHNAATGVWSVGPTYGLNGGRALYGWLHSNRDTGHFPTRAPGAPTSAAEATTPPRTQSKTAQAPTITLPSLAQAALVTGNGALADLVWSDTRTPERPSNSAASTASSQPPPHAVVESLGAPPGVALAPDQRPAVVVLPDGERYVFVRGQDGVLYAAYTSPQQVGVGWQALGAPPSVTLSSSVMALWTRDRGMLVGALGSDGAFWLCSGSAGMLGAWTSLGRPAQGVGFQGTPILAEAPSAVGDAATATTATTVASAPRALAVGTDGRLYESLWSIRSAESATDSSSDSASGGPATSAPSLGWSPWVPVALPADASALTGTLITASRTASEDASALDLMALDAAGRVWLLQSTALGQTWRIASFPTPTATSIPLATILLQPSEQSAQPHVAASASVLQVYVADAQVGASANTDTSPTDTPGAASATASVASSSISQAIQPALTPSATGERISVATFSFADSADSAPAGTTLTLQPLSAWTPLGALASPAPSSTVTPTPAVSSSSAGSAPPDLGASVALDLGAAGSALLLPAGDTISTLGAPGALHVLLPSAKSAAHARPLALGSAPGPASFSDAFSGAVLDPRWLVSGGVASVATGALTLTPSPAATVPAGGLATVVAAQGTPSGDFTVTAHVTPVTQSSAMQSGLTLQLDDWHRVTLALRADQTAHGQQDQQGAPTVALCAVVAGQAPPCQTASPPAQAAPAHGVWLRISQTGATVTGYMSVDGATWTTVGAWTVAWRPIAGAPLGSYAPPIAEIIAPGAPTTAPAFVGPATPGASVWPNFTNIGLFAATTAETPGATHAAPTLSSAGLSDVQFSDFTIR